MMDLKVSEGLAVINVGGILATMHSDLAAARSLVDLVHACDDRDDVKAVLFHAERSDFCPAAGQPLIKNHTQSLTEWHLDIFGPTGLYQSVCYSRKVTITAVSGLCDGIGTLLTLCSDITVTDISAVFRSPFKAFPEPGLTLAALTIGLNRAKAWAMLEEDLSAEQALHFGLINAVCDNAYDGGLTVGRSVAKLPLDGIAMSKLLMEGCLDTQGVAQEFDAAVLAAAGHPIFIGGIPHG